MARRWRGIAVAPCEIIAVPLNPLAAHLQLDCDDEAHEHRQAREPEHGVGCAGREGRGERESVQRTRRGADCCSSKLQLASAACKRPTVAQGTRCAPSPGSMIHSSTMIQSAGPSPTMPAISSSMLSTRNLHQGARRRGRRSRAPKGCVGECSARGFGWPRPPGAHPCGPSPRSPQLLSNKGTDTHPWKSKPLSKSRRSMNRRRRPQYTSTFTLSEQRHGRGEEGQPSRISSGGMSCIARWPLAAWFAAGLDAVWLPSECASPSTAMAMQAAQAQRVQHEPASIEAVQRSACVTPLSPGRGRNLGIEE